MSALTVTADQRLDALVTNYKNKNDDNTGVISQESLDQLLKTIENGVQNNTYVPIENPLHIEAAALQYALKKKLRCKNKA